MSLAEVNAFIPILAPLASWRFIRFMFGDHQICGASFESRFGLPYNARRDVEEAENENEADVCQKPSADRLGAGGGVV